MNARHVAVWVLLAAVLLGLWTCQAVQEEWTSSTRATVGATSAPVDDRDLRIDAWAADTTVKTGTKLPLSFTIYNPTAAAVYVRFTDFRHPGFRPSVPACWANGTPVCIDVRGTPAITKVPPKIEPHRSVTFVANLVAEDEPGRYSVAGVVAWGTDATQITRRKPISLRPIRIEGRFTSAVLLFLRAFQSFVKDLALPLALAFLGFWLKKQEDTRADQRKQDEEDRVRRRKEEEDARLEQRKAAAEKNAQTQQTWNLMLLKSHQNAERHYMPLGTAAIRAAEYWAAVHAAQDAATRDSKIDLCFYSYLLFLSRMRRMTRAIGGFYFKSRDGEIIARTLWSGVVDQTDDVFTRDLRERATALLSPVCTYAEYARSVAAQADVLQMKERFVARMGSLGPMIRRLEALGIVLEFEMNRPYEHWYQQREQFKTAEAAAVVARMRDDGSPELTDLARTFEGYARRAAAPRPGAVAATV